MWGELPDKSRKVTVAKQVLEDFVAGDFEGYELALRAYGHRRKGDGRDSELVVPFGPPEQVVGQVQTFAKDLNPLAWKQFFLHHYVETLFDHPSRIHRARSIT